MEATEATETKKIKKVKGKKFVEKSKLIDKNKLYSLSEALDLLEKTSYTKFDPSIEVHFNTSIDPQKSDQLIRRTMALPHGIKKNIKIVFFGNDKSIEEAKTAGATYIGNAETIEKIKNGWLDFQKVIVTPDQMPKIASLAKILGPKGLMPNPKNNTVTTKVKETIEATLSGKNVEVKNEKDFPIIHTMIGKLSFGKEKLSENFKTVYEGLVNAKPAKVKLPFIKSVVITSTMGPGIKLDQTNL